MSAQLPPPGPHGGDGVAVAKALGIDPATILDLSATLNPLAPPLKPVVSRHLDNLGRYPDTTAAHSALAEAIGGDCAGRLLLTNGASEAIALVAAQLGAAAVVEPEFSLWRRHLASVDPFAPRVRSNPNNPTGRLASSYETAGAWDEAFYQLATGEWTRGDTSKGAFVVGSLTKLFACPGLRLGYVIAPSEEQFEELSVRQPAWSVGSVAAAALPDLLDRADLFNWAKGIAVLRQQLVGVLRMAGLQVEAADAPWVLIRQGGWLRGALARSGIVVRDCTSFGMRDMVRIAVPGPGGLERLALALRQIGQQPETGSAGGEAVEGRGTA